MMKTQLMAGMALSIVLAGGLMPMARATPFAPLRSMRMQMNDKTVQLISETTHKPIANTSIVIMNSVNRLACPDVLRIRTDNEWITYDDTCQSVPNDTWVGKTNASGIILIPHNMIINSDNGSLQIFTKDGNLSNSVNFHSKEFINQSGVFKVNLLTSSSPLYLQQFKVNLSIPSNLTYIPLE
jgi:hypothetical protein